ncbi:MAG: DEAD/DEAH box helicase family protein [Clostridia bacterium]|nr:DEAD/DEAH box helicase family protein [Clostridia bacterium]
MEEVSLFEHNEIAYNRLNEALKNGNCATINHATGTGKSFIALKYLYNNRDKKYLYLAPTYPILDQLIDDAVKLGINPKELNIDRLIYRSLLDMDMTETFNKYDGIIFDEYHRCGAKETFYKIKELKYLLKKNPQGKKFIGLTATPIRYLDNERNMTNEIFDGVVASNLTLANAMCDELLPIPNYYISGGAIVKEFEKLQRKIHELPESATKSKLIHELEMLDVDSFQSEANTDLFNKYMHQDNGKYIIFCKDMEALELLRKNIRRWFKDIKDDGIFIVHSYLNEDERSVNLKAFNDAKEGFNILLCIDVLNEGVHVDNVDGVILNRRTTSPIIYFQQIGRALSFSGRKKEIQVFDLMYNYGNHDAIYAVYDDFREEIQERIKQHPEQKDKYEKMLGKFRIMDESKEMLTKIQALAGKLNERTFIKAKIENAIMCIEKYKRDNKIEEDIFIESVVDEDVIQAYFTLEKYYRYVSNSQFNKLNKLRFVMPPELLMTDEERKSLLGKYDSLYEKEQDETLIIINEVYNYIEKNHRTPQEDSDDLIERNAFELYKQCLMKLSATSLSKISKLALEEEIPLKAWENLLLQIRPSNDEVTSLLEDAIETVKQKNPLPNHIYKAIRTFILRYDFKNQEKVVQLLKYSDRFERLKKQKHLEEQDAIISSITNDFFGEEMPQKEQVLSHVDELIKELDTPYLHLFKRKYEKQKRLFVKSAFRLRNETTMSAYCKNIISLELSEFPKLIKNLEKDIKTYEQLEKVYEFMKEHDDRMPSPNVPEEKELSDSIAKAIKEGMFTDKILRFGLFEFKGDASSRTHTILKEIIDNDGTTAKIKAMIAKEIWFIKLNDRKPCEISPDPAERQIAKDYTKNVVEFLSGHQQLTLANFMNKQIYLKNSLAKRKEFMLMQHDDDKDEI